MLKLILRKLAQGVMLVLLSSTITFALLSTAGGDALSALRDNPQVSAQTIEELRIVYGLDRPVAVRYGTWLLNSLKGDLGESFNFRVPVSGLVMSRLVDTTLASFAAMAIALLISGTFCFFSVRYKWRWLERLNELVILLTASAPRLVLALLALAITVRISGSSPFWLSAFVLATPLIATLLAQLNESVAQTMNEDFVQLARAKGLSERVVIVRHASRAVLNPILTLLGLSFGTLLGGSVIVEAVLGRQGLGTLIVAAVRNRDIPLLMGTMLVVSIAVWLGNAVAEVLQMLNDKRLRSVETS